MVGGIAGQIDSLIVLHILNLNLDIYPAPEIILYQLVAYIKGIALIDMFELGPLVEGNGREDLKGILFLDQG